MNKELFIKHFQTLNRALFLGKDLQNMADYDGPLPIGYGQTISQPTLVAQMTMALDPLLSSRILEIGTGSGYQTALLAPFCQRVYTIERIQALSQKAEKRLEDLGYDNIEFRVGDGSKGWKEQAPFDRILVAAAASELPTELVEQLDKKGRLIIPIGPPGMQDLLLVEKDSSGNVNQEVISKVSFVELIGSYGW